MSAQACVADNDLPLPLAFSGMRWAIENPLTIQVAHAPSIVCSHSQ